MKKNWLLVLLVFSLLGTTVQAADNTLVKEKSYETFDSNEKADFDDKLSQDGKTYKLDKVDYEVVSKNLVIEESPKDLVIKSKPIKKGKTYNAKKSIVKNGITYKLSNVKKKKVVKVKAWKQKVTAYSQYSSRAAAEESAATKTVTVKNKVTNQPELVTCKKTSVNQVADKWVNSKIEIEFKDYDTDKFIWDGQVIEKNEENPLKGHYTDLIKSVGGTEENYKVKSVEWKGDSYEENGTVCRKAIAKVERKIPQYRVTYKGAIKHKPIKATVYTCTYKAKKNEDSEKTKYVMSAKATYKVEDNLVTKIVITTSILLALILVVGILFLILRKKNNKK